MNGVVNDVVVICSDVLLCLKPINIVSKPFWVIGGLKLGFWMKMELEIVGYNSAQMSTRSSEIPFAQARNSLQRPV